MKTQNRNTPPRQGAKRIVGLALSLCIIATSVLLVLALGRFRAYTIEEPSDYGLTLDADHTVDGYFTKENGLTRVGAITDKTYSIDNEQGFVTLARVSRSADLAGYTFRIAARDTFSLKIDLKNGKPVSDTSFFGIGCEAFPFRGSILMVQGTADSTYLKTENYSFLFNYLSNRASIRSESESLLLCAHSDGQFSLCDTLIVDEDGALDISGFRFAAAAEAGVSAAKTAGFVAGTVKAAGGAAVFVDLSRSFPSGEAYVISASAGTAGGLFGVIEAGAAVSVRLGAFAAKVTAAGGDAGLLVGANRGSFTLEQESASLSGTVSAGGAGSGAGLIGANRGAVTFAGALNLNAPAFSGSRAGGVVGIGAAGSALSLRGNAAITSPGLTGEITGGVIGESQGTLTLAEGCTCTVTGGNFTAAGENPVQGGVAGKADTAPGGAFSVSDCAFAAETGTAGGFIGIFTAGTGVSFEQVSVSSSTFAGGRIGGYFGLLELHAQVSLSLSATAGTMVFRPLAAGTTGGVIGELTGTNAGNGVTIRGGTLTNNFENSGFSGTLGGVAGICGANTALGVEGLSVENTMTLRGEKIGDLAGVAADGAVINIKDVTYCNTASSVLVSTTGAGAILRLCGTLTDNSPRREHFVYRQENSLLFVDAGFTLGGAAVQTGNDVGNYGQLIRNDTLGCLVFDETAHTVGFDAPLPGAASLSLSSAADAAKLAITLLCEGYISGVAGVGTGNWSDLLSAAVTLTGDIDLRGSGIEQFTRADKTAVFSGTIRGGSHTLTLAVGENVTGADCGILNPGNERRYLGAFSAMSGAAVTDLKLAGKITFGANVGADTSLGGLAGYTDGAVTVRGCETAVTLRLSGGNFTGDWLNLFAGGLFGQMKNAAFTVENTVLAATILHESGYTRAYNYVSLGGAAGVVGNATRAIFTGNTVRTAITQTPALADARVGGCFADFTAASYIDLDMSGTFADGAAVSANGTGTAGGLIGRNFRFARIVLDTAWSGNVTGGRAASLGGLIYKLEGKLTLEGGFSLSGTLSSSGTNNGCLLADGTGAIVTVKCAATAFDEVTVAKNGFDLLIGKNISSSATNGIAAGGGIATIETAGAGIGQIPTASLWFEKIAAFTASNANTRYYFNVAGLEGYVAASTVGSAADLIYWNVYDFAAASLDARVLAYSYPAEMLNITGAGADVNMSGYCFYPTKKEDVTFLFSGKKLTFGRTLTSAPSQMNGLQCGIFSDIITTDKDNTAVRFGDIRLAGTVCKTGSGGSGAFVCGRLSGSSGTVTSQANVTVSGVFFEGLKVSDTSGYCPLFIHEIGSNTTCEISGISQYTPETYRTASKETAYAAGEKAASSLIGKGGVDSTSAYISVTLKNIVFAGETTAGNRTIFTRATLFDAIRYAENTGCSFVYTFTRTDDWGADAGTYLHNATYGKELYTNPEQYEYYDAAIFVSPVSSSASSRYENFNTDYLLYVYVTSTGEKLRVNRKITSFDGGWGTYENPYLISNADQLLFLARLVASAGTEAFTGGWRILYPKKNGTGFDYTSGVAYVGDGTNTYLTSEDGTATLSAAELLSYLRGAYYRITAIELELSESFNGIGIRTNPFHGVIVGHSATVKTVIRIPAKSGIDKTGFGFINVANGCAIYGIELVYEGVSFSSDSAFLNADTNRANTSTSTPSAKASEVKTNIPYFGGVIGWILGGDNRIENVTVTVGSLTRGNAVSVFGGFAGLISGGGAILGGLGEFALPGGIAAYENYFYYNPYVGKVIGGYAFSVNAAYDNTDKNFTLPQLNFDRYTAGSLITISGNNLYFSPATAEDLLMLSWAMNSGALMYNKDFIGYGNGALSRRGDYSAVGTALPAGETASAGRHKDDESAGGNTLFHTYFAIPASSAKDFRKSELTITLAAAVYDLSEFGNAFRGFGSPFGGTDCYNIKAVTGAVDAAGNPASEIRVNIDLRQYYSGTAIEADGFKNLALFYERNTEASGAINVTFTNVVLSGKLALTYYHATTFARSENKFAADSILFCVGGFMSYCHGAAFNNVGLRDMSIVSPGWAAGLVASQVIGNANCSVTGCTISGLSLEGTQSVGALFSFLRLNTSVTKPISGVTVSDSVILLRTSGIGNRENDKWNQSAGGLIGFVMYNNRALIFENCTISRTAVLFASSAVWSGSINAFAGGLVGRNLANLTFRNCTVDGCVIFSGTARANGTYPFAYRGENPVISGTVYDDIAALVAYSIANPGFAANGSAGGLIGSSAGTVTLNNAAIKSDTATGLIFGFNNAAGVAGEATAAITADGLCISATENPLYLIGRSGAAGVAVWNNYATVTFTVKSADLGGGKSLLFIFGTGNNSKPVAGGFFGDIPNAAVVLEHASLSGCVISAYRAAGISATKSGGGDLTLTDLDLFGNYIQGEGNSAAGIANAAEGTLTLDGLYFGDNVIRLAESTTGLGFLADTVSGTLAGYFVLMRNNDVGYAASTVRADALMGADGLAALTAPAASYSGVGHIAYHSSGTVQIFALSLSVAAGERAPAEKQIVSGKATVLYAAYGAPEKYWPARGTDGELTHEGAINAMTAEVDKNDSAATAGDPVTKTDGVFTPDHLYALDWWGAWTEAGNAVKPASGKLPFARLGDYAELCGFPITANAELPVFTINGGADSALAALLNLITGGGFATMTGVFDIASVTAVRYNVENGGKLTLQDGEQGSVLYENGAFRAGVYDILSADKQTITILTVVFGADKSGSSYGKTYAVNVIVYYPQILTVKTNISVIEGEVYRLASFLQNPAFKADISMGSSFSFFVEYAYSAAVENINGFNFGKRIHSVLGDGKGNGRAFPAGTTVILLDLNSVSPAGFRYYYHVVGEDADSAYYLRFTEFADITSGTFSPKLLELIRENGLYEEGHLYQNIEGEFTAAAVERYLMVVLPAEENTPTYQYNLKAEVEENDRNIVVESTENLCRISVWNEEGGSLTIEWDNTVFSNNTNGELTAGVSVSKPFSDGYYTAMGQRTIFGTHVFRVLDADKRAVSLPAGTVITLRDGKGNVLYRANLTAPASSIRYGVGNIMEQVDPATRTYTGEITVTLDFSGVTAREFNEAFSGGAGLYFLRDDFYLSGDSNHYLSGAKLTGEKQYHTEAAAPVKVALIPTDRKHLGINLADPADTTNNGKIAFRLTADFGAIPEAQISNAAVTFSLLEKFYNTETGQHEYREIAMSGFAAVTDAAGQAFEGEQTVTLSEEKLDAEFLLTLDHAKANITNYRLKVTVTGKDAAGTAYAATDYFVFLYCNIADLTD